MTTSFPAVGLGGLGAEAWASTFGGRDGIVEDYLGTAFTMTLLNTDEAQFTAANISNNGYTLVVGGGDKVPLPAPASGSKTYYIGSLYDPDLQVALPDGTADPAGPCRLVAFGDTIDTSNGKRFLILYVVTRTAAALTGAPVADRRRWVGVSLEYPDGATDAAPGNEGSYPRGSIRYGTNRILFRGMNSAGVLTWLDPLSSGPTPLPLLSAFIARAGKTSTPQYYRFSGNMIGLEGQVQRSSGNLSNGSTVELGTMPVGKRPAFTRSWNCRCGGTDNYAEVRINTDGSTDGKILMTDPPSSTTWLDLSPISYRIGA